MDYQLSHKQIKIENADKQQLEDVDVETADSPDIIPMHDLLEKNKKNNVKTIRSHYHNNTTNIKLESCVGEVEERFRHGCDCTSSCFDHLDAENVYKHRLNVAELTKEEHDMYLMGVTMASLANRQQTHRNKERQRQRASYVYQGKRVCLEAFLYLENVTQYHLKIIRNHLLKHGVTPRVHGNMGKKPYNTFSLDMYKCAESFVKQMINTSTQQHQDRNNSKPFILTGETRRSIYNKFMESGICASSDNGKIMGFSTFRHFMKKQFPLVKFAPKIDSSKLPVNTQIRDSTMTLGVKEKSPKKLINLQMAKSIIGTSRNLGRKIPNKKVHVEENDGLITLAECANVTLLQHQTQSSQSNRNKQNLILKVEAPEKYVIIAECNEDNQLDQELVNNEHDASTYFLTEIPAEVTLLNRVDTNATDQIDQSNITN